MVLEKAFFKNFSSSLKKTWKSLNFINLTQQLFYFLYISLFFNFLLHLVVFEEFYNVI